MFYRYGSSEVRKLLSIIYLDLFYCLSQPFAGHLNSTVCYDPTLVSLERAQMSRDFLDCRMSFARIRSYSGGQKCNFVSRNIRIFPPRRLIYRHSVGTEHGTDSHRIYCISSFNLIVRNFSMRKKEETDAVTRDTRMDAMSA